MFGHSVKILAKTTIINCTAQGWHGREILQAERGFQTRLSENSMKKGYKRTWKNRNPAACQCKGKRTERRSGIALLDRSSSLSLYSPLHAIPSSVPLLRPQQWSSLIWVAAS
jgi:hypothetical protein